MGSSGASAAAGGDVSVFNARMLAYELGIPMIPSPAYPAVGDGVHNAASLAACGTDDAAIIQQAMADHQGSAIMFAPKTFRVNTKLNRSPDKTKRAARLLGLSASNGSRNLTGGPTLLWGGAVGGTLMENRVTGQNIPDGGMEGINLRGYGSQCQTLYATGSTTTTAAKPDSGSELRRVNFGNCTGDPIVIDGDGVTFMQFDTVRFDACAGRVRVRVISDTDLRFSNVYYDNNTLPAGGTADGWILMDCSSIGANATARLKIDMAKLEAQTDLTDVAAALNTDYATSDQADRRGMIQCIINPAQQRTQLRLLLDDVFVSGASGRTSFSLVLPLGGTELNRRARIAVNGRIVESFGGDGTALTGHRLPIGGIPDADKDHVIKGLTGSSIDGWLPKIEFWPGGDNLFASEDSAAYINV